MSNQRKRERVWIPCFGNSFKLKKISAVLYVTNARPFQMIEQLLGSPVAYQFYDTQFLACESSSPPPRVTQLPSETCLL